MLSSMPPPSGTSGGDTTVYSEIRTDLKAKVTSNVNISVVEHFHSIVVLTLIFPSTKQQNPS